MHNPKGKLYTTAAIYAASSSSSRRSNVSIKKQVIDCWHCSNERGWKVEYVFIDLGENRYLMNRTNFRKMIKGARTGKFDIVVLCKLENLCSSLADLVNTKKSLRQLGIPFHSTDE